VQAREKGYHISGVSIPFAERAFGNSKVNVMQVGSEIVIEAIKFKFCRRKLVAYIEDLNNGEA
jgi:hypothetical protein